jgi:glucosylceramidase
MHVAPCLTTEAVMVRSGVTSLVLGTAWLLGCGSGGGGETLGSSASATTPSAVRSWITSDPKSAFVSQPETSWHAVTSGAATLVVDDAAQRQEVDGFGAALTDASAAIMYYEMSDAAREALLSKLVSPTTGLGLSMIRLPIAASDSTWNGAYSYDDWGDAHDGDKSLSHFSVEHDRTYIIPTLQKMLALNANIHVVATPWSPPEWMKQDSLGMIGGTLRAGDEPSYAEYITDFVRKYWESGIPIYALTPQNEPGQAANYPSMTFPAIDEAAFITNHLRPTLDAAQFDWVRILGYDHNWNNSYPSDLLGDLQSEGALADLDGIAFHCYGSDPEGNAKTLSTLHDDPRMAGKEIYLTECDRSQTPSGSNAGHDEGIQKLIYAMNNWSRSYLAWQIVLHPDGTPNQGSGCMHKNADGTVEWHCVGVVSVDTSGDVTNEWDYAYLGHASKFVARSAHVIPLPSIGSVDSVAFVNPNGDHVVVAFNAATTKTKVQVEWAGQAFSADIPARSAATYVW